MDKPIDPDKRAQQIRDAIARRKIKQSLVIEQTLKILDQIAETDRQEKVA